MMEHIIWTSFGGSTDSSGDFGWRLPPHDTIQSNGLSPLIWAVINIVLFLAIKDKPYGGILRRPITGLLTSLAGFGFVDDIDFLQTQHYTNEPIFEIVDKLQGSLDVWQGTIRSSGGSLDCDDPNRSYWYGIDHKWKSNGR